MLTQSQLLGSLWAKTILKKKYVCQSIAARTLNQSGWISYYIKNKPTKISNKIRIKRLWGQKGALSCSEDWTQQEIKRLPGKTSAKEETASQFHQWKATLNSQFLQWTLFTTGLTSLFLFLGLAHSLPWL